MHEDAYGRHFDQSDDVIVKRTGEKGFVFVSLEHSIRVLTDSKKLVEGSDIVDKDFCEVRNE